MFDFRAGVRITARHCFMLELLSVHVRPSLCLSVRSSLPPSPSSSSSPSIDKKKEKDFNKAREGRGDAAEVQFEDEMWDELLDGGYICGEERWLIGQDRSKRITIVWF